MKDKTLVEFRKDFDKFYDKWYKKFVLDNFSDSKIIIAIVDKLDEFHETLSGTLEE